MIMTLLGPGVMAPTTEKVRNAIVCSRVISALLFRKLQRIPAALQSGLERSCHQAVPRVRGGFFGLGFRGSGLFKLAKIHPIFVLECFVQFPKRMKQRLAF
ncbi:hypothetical protein [Rhizobium yanglingense]